MSSYLIEAEPTKISIHLTLTGDYQMDTCSVEWYLGTLCSLEIVS